MRALQNRMPSICLVCHKQRGNMEDDPTVHVNRYRCAYMLSHSLDRITQHRYLSSGVQFHTATCTLRWIYDFRMFYETNARLVYRI